MFTVREKLSDDVIENIFLQRGIQNYQEFLDISNNKEMPWENLMNMEKGLDCFLSHMKKKSPVDIIVDCDNDGFHAAAILVLYMRQCFPDIEIRYHLHTGKEHGVSQIPPKDLPTLPTPENMRLLIIPDAGSNDYKAHKKYKEAGVDVLVLDHHIVDGDIESQDAIVINNQLTKGYNPNLCGAAIVYKFCKGLDDRLGQEGYAEQHLDLVAFAMVADMIENNVPESFFLIQQGITHLHNKFLQQIVRLQDFSLKGNITPIGISFYIAPYINGLIRVGTQEEKQILFEAYLTPEKEVQSKKRGAKPGDIEILGEQAFRIAGNARNKQNKQIETFVTTILKNHKEAIENAKIGVIEVTKTDLDNALTGLVANKIAAQYKKPILLLRMNPEGTALLGSGRGFGIDDFKGYLGSTNLFTFVSGHKNAFGVGILKENLEIFKERIEEELKDIDFSESHYEVDVAWEDYEIDGGILEKIGSMSQYWHRGLTEPLFAIKELPVTKKNISIIGTKKDTLKITHGNIAFMRFKLSPEEAEDIQKNIDDGNDFLFSFVGTANLNIYNGRTTPQLFMKYYKYTITEMY